ncbi:MAG TPA: protein kinase, partial [Polyangiaceae bacterium]
ADRGFSRLVAIKMLTSDGPNISSIYAHALEEEARIASRIRHPNVVQPLDFVVDGDDLLVVMEYVHGETLAGLLRLARQKSQVTPLAVVVRVLCDALDGLHAAHTLPRGGRHTQRLAALSKGFG